MAAITLPTLISNYQKQIYVNKLKKQYTMLANVFKGILVEEGVSSLSDTSIFQAIPADGCNYDSFRNNINCDEFYNKLPKYLRIS